jgi:hypothetical protein
VISQDRILTPPRDVLPLAGVADVMADLLRQLRGITEAGQVLTLSKQGKHIPLAIGQDERPAGHGLENPGARLMAGYPAPGIAVVRGQDDL